MGDEVNLVAIEVIQGGLLQLDFLPETKDAKGFRVFVEPVQFFAKLGEAWQDNREAWLKVYEKSREEG